MRSSSPDTSKQKVEEEPEHNISTAFAFIHPKAETITIFS